MAEPEPLDLDAPYWRAAFADALIAYFKTRPAGAGAGLLAMIEQADREHRERGERLPLFMYDVREAIMQGDPKQEERDEFLANAIGDALPPRLAADKSREAMRRWLDELEAVHRDSGVEPPSWIDRARRLHLGEEDTGPGT